MRDMLKMAVTGSIQTKKLTSGRQMYYLVADFPRKKGEKRQIKWISTGIENNGSKKAERAAEKFRADKLYDLNIEYAANKQREADSPSSAPMPVENVPTSAVEDAYLSMTDAVDLVLAYKKRSVTPTTLAAYRYTYQNFAAFVGAEQSFWELTGADIIRFMDTQNLKDVSYNIKKTILVNFFQILYDIYDKDLPKMKTIKKKNEARIYKVPEQKFYSFVIEAIYADTDSKMEMKKDYLLKYRPLFFFLAFGLRSGEIRGLQWKDVDFRRRSVTLMRHVVKNVIYPYTKNKKPRTIMIPETGIGMLKRDMENTMNRYGIDERTLQNRFIIGGKTKPISYPTMAKYFKTVRNYYQNLMYGQTIEEMRMHDFRHGVASICMDQNVDLKSIGSLLGHSRLATTERYIHALNNTSDKPTPVIASLL